MNISEILKMDDYEINRKIIIKGTEHDRKRKLTDVQVTEIKTAYDNGESVESLASTYGVVPKTIRWHLSDDYRRTLINQMVPTSAIKRRTPNRIEELRDRAEYKRQLVASGRISL